MKTKRSSSEIARVAALPRWRQADARSVLDAWKSSGQSLAEFAAEHDLDPQRLWYWRRKLDELDVSEEAENVPLAPVVVTGVGHKAVLIARVGAMAVEIVNPPAVDPRWVAGLLDAVADTSEGGD